MPVLLAVLRVLLRRRLAVLLVLLVLLLLAVLLILRLRRLAVLLVLSGGLAVVPLLLRGGRALRRRRRGRRRRGLDVFPLLGVIVLLRNGGSDRRAGGVCEVRRPRRETGRASPNARASAGECRYRDATREMRGSSSRAGIRRRVKERASKRCVRGIATSTRFFSPIADHAPTPWGAASAAAPRKVSAAGTG